MKKTAKRDGSEGRSVQRKDNDSALGPREMNEDEARVGQRVDEGEAAHRRGRGLRVGEGGAARRRGLQGAGDCVRRSPAMSLGAEGEIA